MKGEESSGLELLLDTMCNTFGGVMFIAITVAVVLFSKSALEEQKSATEMLAERREELLAQIARLRTMLDEQSERQLEMVAALKMMEEDPRLKLIRQLALMEALAKNEREALALAEKKSQLLDQALLPLSQKVSELSKRLTKVTEAVLDKEKILAELTEENERLKKLLTNAIPRHMTFTMLETHDDRINYFILLRQGKLWRVGPSSTVESDGFQKPLEDVDFTVKNNAVICVPKAGAGVPALDGEQLSQECKSLLAAIPPKRGARFCFSAEDSAVFYKMRELLKARGFFHGFSLEKENGTFTYYLMDKVHYEY